jgi:hypothetical protein
VTVQQVAVSCSSSFGRILRSGYTSINNGAILDGNTFM